MADDYRGSRGYPRREGSDGSNYPPPPEDENDRRPQYPLPPVSSSAGLPPMTYPPPSQGYPPDQRYSDPRYSQERGPWPSEPQTNPNGYAPPPDSRYPLPAPSPNDRRPYDDRSRQYGDRGQPYDDRRPYPESYYAAQSEPPRSAAPSYGYTYPQQPHGYQYPPPAQAPPPQPQAAPRQRTSIACRYCRKRKIRCSGYANTPNGKCTNCDKLRIDCVFQPVSSNASTAFVPVSAVPGGVPPGTPLYGAYGQPLPSSSGQQAQATQPYPSTSDYPPPAHSPTSQYPAPYDDRGDPGRRRTRPPEEDHALRLPPPNYPSDDDPRRRSPSSNHSNGTPPTGYRPYPPSGYDHQSQPGSVHRTSPGGPPPGPAPQLQPSLSGTDVMSVNSLMASADSRDRGSGHDIDRSMLGKLNRRS